MGRWMDIRCFEDDGALVSCIAIAFTLAVG